MSNTDNKVYVTPDKKDIKTLCEFIDKQYITVGTFLQKLVIEKAEQEGKHFKEVKMPASFQRRWCWNKHMISNLVLTVLTMPLGIPEIEVYRENNNSQFRKTIDGQQRLTSLYLFYNNKVPLNFKMSEVLEPTFEIEGQKYSVANDLDGKYFKDLPELWQDIFKNYMIDIRCYNNCNDEEAERRFVIKNGNTKSLRASEIRLAGMGGDIRSFMKEMLGHDWMLHATTPTSIAGSWGTDIASQIVAIMSQGKAVELSADNLNTIIYKLRQDGMSETTKSNIRKTSEYLNNVTNIWIDERKEADKSRVRGRKISNYNTFRFTFLNKTNTVMLFMAAALAIKNHVNEEVFAKWAQTFFRNPTKEYSNALGEREKGNKAIDFVNVEARLNVIAKEISNLPVGQTDGDSTLENYSNDTGNDTENDTESEATNITNVSKDVSEEASDTADNAE